MLPSQSPAVKQFHLLAFHSACGDTLGDLLAEEHVEEQHRNQSNHQCSKLLSEVTTQSSCKLLNSDRQALESITTGQDIDQHKLIPSTGDCKNCNSHTDRG